MKYSSVAFATCFVVVAAGGGTAIGGGLPTSDTLIAFKLGTTATQ